MSRSDALPIQKVCCLLSWNFLVWEIPTTGKVNFQYFESATFRLKSASSAATIASEPNLAASPTGYPGRMELLWLDNV